MRVSLNWLKEYIDLDGVSVEQLAHDLTMLGLEIEKIEQPGAEITNVVIGRILSIDKHPEADKIVVCKTDVGGPEPLTICCGATNMKPGDIVPTAVEGASLPGGFKIGRRKMRGIESQGMMCSARELGLGEEYDGLLILPQDLPIGADAKPLLGLDDVIFEIEITPNRGDWASMIGVARELAARYGRALRIPEVSVPENGKPIASLSSVTMEAPELCGRYLGRVFNNIKVGPSPAWLTKRVQAGGMRPINNIVDITNYVLLETGQPLHAFDYDKLAEHRIVVRTAKPGEHIRTLDGQDRPLAMDMLVIADAKAAQCVAGVMGGAESEVGEGTTRIFLESAWFQPGSVRKISRALQLASESSQRFQRGADPEMALYALNRAAALIAEIAGAEVAAGYIDEHPKPKPRVSVTLRFARTNRLLGAEVPAAVQTEHLRNLGFEVGESTTDTVTVRVPSWRPDVTMETDLIEEVLRLHGFDNIPASLPRLPHNEKDFAGGDEALWKLRHFLVDQGLTELIHWTFSNEDDLKKAGLDPTQLPLVLLQNPLSERHAGMRSSLMPTLLNCAAYNINQGNRDIAAFEIGAVYQTQEGQNLPGQTLRLGILLSGQAEAANWATESRPVDFYDLKGIVEAVGERLGLTFSYMAIDHPSSQAGQAAIVLLDGQLAGHIGKVNPAVCKNFGIEQSVFLAGINLDVLLAAETKAVAFAELPAFPPSLRDLAVLVDKALPAGVLLETVQKAGGNLLRSAQVFDIYAGKQVPAGKKSVAIGLTFQSQERTLTDADTQKSFDKILKQLTAQHGAELR